MILKLLSDVLEGEIPLDFFLQWLKSNKTEGLALISDISPAEFAVGVLNFLRKYTARYFNNDLNTKPEKKFLVFESKRCEIKPKPRRLPAPESPEKRASLKAINRKGCVQPFTDKDELHLSNMRQKLTERLIITDEVFPSLADTSSKNRSNHRGGRGRKQSDDKQGNQRNDRQRNDGQRNDGQRNDGQRNDGQRNNRMPMRKKPTQISLGSFFITEKDHAQNVTSNPIINTQPTANMGCERNAKNRGLEMPWSGKRKKGKPPTSNALLQQRLDLTKSLQKVVITQEKSSSEQKPINTIVPDESRVEKRDILNKLCEIYTCFFELFLIPDLGSELCFILSLLVVMDNGRKHKAQQMKEEEEEDGANELGCNNITTLFNSVHNCVYFASIVLNTQRHVLVLLDRATMDFLIQNTRIYKFHPELYQYLTEIHAKRVQVEMTENKLPAFTGNLSSVMFVCENDAKPNFPTMASFHAFSKQRDAFYDILKLWEQNYTKENWSFVDALHTMIQDLINMHPEPTNYAHLARLFRSQLVISCVGFAKDEDCEGECDISFTNRERFNRLQNRFKGYTQHVGPHRPEFPEYQEFFRCFIVTANDDKFFTHLRDSLSSEILALNSTTFMALGVDDRATFVDDKTRLNYLRCAASLRILGKFLAFVTFLPYRTNTKLTEQIAAAQLKVRSQLAPPPDILRCITQAVTSGSLVLTIPWVVQYLALVDEISLRLSYFRKVVVNLFTIYSHIGEHVSIASNIVIRLSIGWLLESHNFRRGLYLKWHSQHYNPNLLSKENEKLRTSNLSCLDSLEMIDSRVLYFICPYLDDFKAVLASEEGPINPGFYQISSVRRASLRTVEDLEAEKIAKADEKLYEDINEDFFRNYPESVRSVVCFVGENVASSCVRRLICGDIVSKVIDEGVAKLRMIELIEYADPFDIDQYCATETLVRCEQEIYKYCNDRCYIAIPALMAATMLADVETFCVRIAANQAINKVLEWIALNINADFFRASLLLSSKRKKPPPPKLPGLKTSNKADPLRKVVHLRSAPAPQYTIRLLKELVRKVSYPNPVDSKSIETVLEMVSQTVQHRADLIQLGESSLYRLLLQLAQQLVCSQPELLTYSLLDQFQALWQLNELKVYVLDLKCLVSERMLLKMDRQSQPKALMWAALGRYLLSLLIHGQLSAKSVERQFLATFSLRDIPQETIDEMKKCAQFIIVSYRNEVENGTAKFQRLESYVLN